MKQSTIINGAAPDGTPMSLQLYEIVVCNWVTQETCILWMSGISLSFQFTPSTIDPSRDMLEGRFPRHHPIPR